jgi:diacylglycerol kinase family enzyme
MNVTLIHNPDSGDAAQPSADELVALIRNAGHDVTAVSSQDRWRAAIEEPGDVVAVAGGDGTVGAVALALVGRRLPLAVLPLGTANNISKTLGLTDKTLEQLIDGWNQGRLRKLDVGIATGPWGSTCFIEGLGMGLFAGTMAKLDARRNIELIHLHDAEEKIASVVQMMQLRLEDHPATPLNVTLDGQDVSGEYLLLEVLNTQSVGPNLSLAPHADPGDGVFDVVLVRKDERAQLSDYLTSCLTGRPGSHILTVRQGRHLEVVWTGFSIHIDDKAWPGTESTFPLEPGAIDITVDPCAVSFLVPSGFP